MKKIAIIAGALLVLSTGVWATNNNAPKYKTFQLPENVTEINYQTNVINFRVKAQYRNSCTVNSVNNAAMQQALATLMVTNLSKTFPRAVAPEAKYNNEGLPLQDLSLIYRVKFSATMPIEVACNNLLASGILEYAEPNYMYHVNQYVPNDPNAVTTGGTQSNFLNRIKAYDAWDLAQGGSQGDTSVVVAIVDTGSDLDHPDLMANIKLNYADPVNGTDDDADGYIDNYYGWDLSGTVGANLVADNNPTCAAANTHGAHVSGCASEVTDNGIGGAGIGFKTKLLIVKCAADDESGLGTAYDGIVYAADHGARIINCSWGGTFGGVFGQNIVDYATNNKNSLVVAAAGNSNSGADHFPSCYNGVLSVAATNNANDGKASFSNYSYTVGVSAPGVNIHSTDYNNIYANNSGTSMASPIVAGACALVKAKFPAYTATQIKERIRVTANPHYALAANSGFKGRLGKGRLNVFKALTDGATPSVRFNSINITDGNDGAFVIGDTLRITGVFKNYLDASSANLTVAMYNANNIASYLTVLPADSQKVLGVINTNGTVNNATAFKVKLNAGIPANATIVVKLVYRDGAYLDEQFFPITVNVDYLNVAVNEVFTTVTSKGREFYNTDSQADGLGFVFKDSSLAYEGGFMVGAIKPSGDTVVINNVRTATATPAADWKSLSNIKRNTTNPTAVFEASGKFNDAGIVVIASRLNINVAQKFYAFDTPGNTRYVIHEFTIKNATATALNNFYAGIFTDWDIMKYSNNKSAQDSSLRLGYAYSTDVSGIYAGVKVLTHTPYSMYAADNKTGAGGPGNINFSDGVTVGEKYRALTQTRATAGDSANGNDVINVVSSGPFNLNTTTDSVVIAFAILAGDNQADLINNANAAQAKYDIVTSNKALAGVIATNVQLYPNPANTATQVIIDLATQGLVKIEMYSIKGDLLSTVVNETMTKGAHNITINTANFAQGAYYCKVITGEQIQIKKLSIVR
jgi:serine protease